MNATRVLVVDDDSLVREALRGLLEDVGIEIVGEGATGAEGVSLAQEMKPDVVLMDMRMPVMGGIEATAEIRRTLPDAQVVLLTAYDDPALMLAAEDAGVYAFLVKGCHPQIVIDVIGQAGAMKLGLEARQTGQAT